MDDCRCPVVNGRECVLLGEPGHTISDVHEYREVGAGKREWTFRITVSIPSAVDDPPDRPMIPRADGPDVFPPPRRPPFPLGGHRL